MRKIGAENCAKSCANKSVHAQADTHSCFTNKLCTSHVPTHDFLCTSHPLSVGQALLQQHASKHEQTSANFSCAHYTCFLLARRSSITMHPNTQTITVFFTIQPSTSQVQTVGAHTTPAFCWPDASALVCIQARRHAQLCSQSDRACYKCKLLVRTPHLFFVGRTHQQ